jgi:DNA-binding NarL/FixJ family response regulator
MNPDGTGAFVAAPVSGKRRRGAEWTARWAQLAAHLAAGMRLRRTAQAIDRTADTASAVFTPGGRVLEISAPTESARDLLRHAVTEMDRARSRRGRQDERAALEGWRALVDGRWSLVDHFEADGKRHVIALENAPDAPDPRALAPEERPVLHYVAMGHANKLIAYELGLPLGTVASRVAGIMRKLGVKTRVEIVDRYLALTEMEFAPLAVGTRMYAGTAVPGARIEQGALTPAEREVVDMVTRGLSNKGIAETRGCSPHTVANILASVFKKLGIGSRAELTRFTRECPAPRAPSR